MNTVLDISKALSIKGYMSESELQWLAHMAEKRERILEVGCYKGRSTRALADNTNGIVFAVDTWNCKIINEDGSPSFVVNDDTYEEFTRNMVGVEQRLLVYRTDFGDLNINSSLDFIFIDGEHRYEQVKKDIWKGLKLIEKGGILSGHDYNDPYWPGVKQAVDELLGEVNIYKRIWWKIIND